MAGAVAVAGNHEPAPEGGRQRLDRLAEQPQAPPVMRSSIAH
jgi:hypothetical protein